MKSKQQINEEINKLQEIYFQSLVNGKEIEESIAPKIASIALKWVLEELKFSASTAIKACNDK